MKHVLVTVWSGIIDQVIFFDDESKAILALAEYVKSMNVEKEDAAVFGPDGMTANAKDFLDDNEQYYNNINAVLARAEKSDEHIYIIGNPRHPLGFIVASPDDPLGYRKSAAALSDLGQMRQDHGPHLKLYYAVPIVSQLTTKKILKKYNSDCGVEDFDCSLVEEYLV